MSDEFVEENGVEEEAPAAEGGEAERPARAPRGPRRQMPPRGAGQQQGDAGGRPGGGGFRRGGQFQARRRACMFCSDKVRTIDWKNADGLRRFVNENGDMRPRRKTGTCARHQRRLAQAIKRARYIALLPYTSEHVRLSGLGRR